MASSASPRHGAPEVDSYGFGHFLQVSGTRGLEPLELGRYGGQLVAIHIELLEHAQLAHLRWQ